MPSSHSGSTPRERELFETALEIEDAGERRRWLDAACGTDDALRSRVEALLVAAGSDPEFLPERSAAAPVPGVPDSGMEAPGDAVGRYHLLERIGEGGCGVVYMAEQRDPVRRRVALKILKPGMDTRSVVARFEAERQALALMEHPNIARVFDGGATPTGRPYFVMELVRGVRITEYCDAHRLSTRERLELFLQVCGAIQHAHQKGVIHRDIKPSNILVTVNDGVPVPKVIDFGIAKATGQSLTDKTLFTQFHALIGTPAYMSPEQAEMSSLDVDTRTDVYSLGVLLYELLTGRTPFDTRELLSAGIDGMRQRLREQEPERPSTRLRALPAAELTTTADLRRRVDGPRLVSDLRGDLDWIVLKCLEKDRNRRFDSVGTLAADIRHHLADEPVTARPPSVGYRIRKVVVRHRLAVTSGLLVFLSLFTATAVSLRLMLREAAARGRAETESARANREAAGAREAERSARRSAYAADMRAAQTALASDDLGRTRALLDAYLPVAGEEDLRGPEWRWLREAARDEATGVLPHPGIVHQVLLSGNERRLFSICFDGVLRSWDTVTRRLVREFPGAGGETGARSADGRWLATTDGMRTTLRDGTEGTVVREIPGLGPPLCFSSSGPWIFGMRSGTLVRHDWETGIEEILPEILRGSTASRLGPAGPGRMVASSRIGGTAVVLCDDASGAVIRPLNGMDGVVAVAGSPDGRWVVAGSPEGEIALWEAETGRLRARMPAHGSWAMAFAFSPDGRLLASGGGDQRLRLWHLPPRPDGVLEQEADFQGHSSEIWGVRFLNGGHQLASGGKDASIRLWEVRLGRRAGPDEIPHPEGPVVGADDGGRTAVSANGHQQLVWTSLDDGREVRRQQMPIPMAVAPWLTGAGEAVVSNDHGTVVGWDVRAGVERWRRDFGGGWLRASGDGGGVGTDHHVVLVGWHPRPRCLVVRASDGHVVHECPDYAGVDATYGRSATLSRDGRRLAYAVPGFRIRVQQLGNPHPPILLQGLTWNVFSIAFSPDGRRVAASGWDGRLGIWDADDGRVLIPPFLAHAAGVNRVEFSPDGLTVITTGEEPALRFWNAANGRLMLEFRNAMPIDGNLFAMGGRVLLHGVADGPEHRLRRIQFPPLDAVEN